MSSLVLFVPGRVDTLTGGYAYDRQMVAGLRRLGWSVVVRELDESFPQPTAAARSAAAAALSAVPDATTVLSTGSRCDPDGTWREAAVCTSLGWCTIRSPPDGHRAAHRQAFEESSPRWRRAWLVIVTSCATRRPATLRRRGEPDCRGGTGHRASTPGSRIAGCRQESALCGEPRATEGPRRAAPGTGRGAAHRLALDVRW